MFNALVVNKDEESGKTSAAVEQISTDQLPEGNVVVNVEYSTVNYKGRPLHWSRWRFGARIPACSRH